MTEEQTIERIAFVIEDKGIYPDAEGWRPPIQIARYHARLAWNEMKAIALEPYPDTYICRNLRVLKEKTQNNSLK